MIDRKKKEMSSRLDDVCGRQKLLHLIADILTNRENPLDEMATKKGWWRKSVRLLASCYDTSLAKESTFLRASDWNLRQA